MTASASRSRSHSRASSSSSSATGSSRKRGNPTKNPKNTIARWSKSPFTDFGSYMAEKNRKLREQFDADASTSSIGSGHGSGGDGKGIFHGVSIFVDGFTIPSSQELRVCMLKHGGRFENYFSRHRVSHIICSHLPDSKMRNLRGFSGGVPVVKPSWVLDSVVAGKLLSWVPYQLEDFTNRSSRQQKLSAFFTPKSVSTFKGTNTFEDPCLRPESEQILSNKEESEGLLPWGSKFLDYRMQDREESQFISETKVHNGENSAPKSTAPEDEHSVMEASEPNPDTSLNMSSGSGLGNRPSEEILTKHPRVSSELHSTLGDRDFVKNYFKNSRLHFIGTWRNRYRKQFSHMLTRNKPQSTSVDFLSATRRPAIIHIDMDCFFVSVVIRNHPELRDKPVAVCHSDNPKGTAEISSANYPARDYGVRAGMFVRDAKAHCPHLVIFPYDFEAYQEVADQFYGILHKHCDRVQALSCDEALLDVTKCCNDDPEQIAVLIRKEIYDTTGCTASAGIAENLLLARLATRSAKPNSQYFIPSEKVAVWKVDEYLKDLPIKALPGIGFSLGEKLKMKEINTCGQLCMISKESLHEDFGSKVGDMLWNYSRGIDSRSVEVVQEMKSVGAEVNWGVRFNDDKDCHHFLMSLCEEVSVRLHACGVRGRTITLKIKKRRKGAEEPIKFMGCGDCENMSHSNTLPVATDSVAVLRRMTKQLFSFFYIDVREIRGVGLQVSKLEHIDISRQGCEDNTLESWLSSASKRSRIEYKERECEVVQKDNGVLFPDGEHLPSSVDDVGGRLRSSEFRSLTLSSTLPPLSHLDIEVIRKLPNEIVSEMNDLYEGKLCAYVEKHEANDTGTMKAYLSRASAPKSDEIDLLSNSEGDGTLQNGTTRRTDCLELYSGAKDKGNQLTHSASGVLDTSTADKLVLAQGKSSSEASSSKSSKVMELMVNQTHQVTLPRSDDMPMSSSGILHVNNLMPGSLSQADASDLQQLPEDLVADIFNSIPAHRTVRFSDAADISTICNYNHSKDIKDVENSKVRLWIGNPPNWVQKFKECDCFLLKLMAQLYSMSGGNGLLSCTLQSLVSFLSLSFDSQLEPHNESLRSFCELLLQYIDLKIESDIEELYFCFRLLKRFTAVSIFFREVYRSVHPSLQISARENYGGEFELPID